MAPLAKRRYWGFGRAQDNGGKSLVEQITTYGRETWVGAGISGQLGREIILKDLPANR